MRVHNSFNCFSIFQKTTHHFAGRFSGAVARFGVHPDQQGIPVVATQVLLHGRHVLERVVGNHPVVMVTGEQQQGGELPAGGHIVDGRVPGRGGKFIF